MIRTRLFLLHTAAPLLPAHHDAARVATRPATDFVLDADHRDDGGRHARAADESARADDVAGVFHLLVLFKLALPRRRPGPRSATWIVERCARLLRPSLLGPGLRRGSGSLIGSASLMGSA